MQQTKQCQHVTFKLVTMKVCGLDKEKNAKDFCHAEGCRVGASQFTLAKMQLQMFVFCCKCCLISDKGMHDSFKDSRQHSWSLSKIYTVDLMKEYWILCGIFADLVRTSLKCAFEKRKCCSNETAKKKYPQRAEKECPSENQLKVQPL